MNKKTNDKKYTYKDFVLHVKEWNKNGIPWGLSDLRDLAIKYGMPIPKEHKK